MLPRVSPIRPRHGHGAPARAGRAGLQHPEPRSARTRKGEAKRLDRRAGAGPSTAWARRGPTPPVRTGAALLKRTAESTPPPPSFTPVAGEEADGARGTASSRDSNASSNTPGGKGQRPLRAELSPRAGAPPAVRSRFRFPHTTAASDPRLVPPLSVGVGSRASSASGPLPSEAADEGSQVSRDRGNRLLSQDRGSDSSFYFNSAVKWHKPSR